MILQFLIQGFVQFISAIIDSLPVFPVLTFVSDSLQFIQWIAWTNYYLPLEDFFVGAGAVLTAWVVSAVVRVVIDII